MRVRVWAWVWIRVRGGNVSIVLKPSMMGSFGGDEADRHSERVNADIQRVDVLALVRVTAQAVESLRIADPTVRE